MVLKGLKPEKVFEYFELLCSVPHGSGNTKQISDLCVNFAKERGLKYRQDEYNNVIIFKEASVGYENAAPVILQGHMDMVCAAEPDCGIDMKLGFNSGTDDYMVKPIDVNEMVLRVGALLRRARMINERRLVMGTTVMECDSLTVISGEHSSVLPQKEFMLLFKMASFPGRIFTRQQLMDDIWGYEAGADTHTVDVHIARLRERFRDNTDFRIVTMRGVGYKVVKI